MADVRESGGDRAQLILVSALTIAVTLLVLVVLLNTTIYTENVATRGIDSEVRHAAQFQAIVEDGVADIARAEEDDDWDALEANVTTALDVLMAQQRNVSLERGHLASGELTDLVPGIHVTDDAVSGNDTTVVTNVTSGDRFNVSIQNASAWDADDRIAVDINGSTVVVNGTENGTSVLDGNGTEICGSSVLDGNATLWFVRGEIVSGNDTSTCLDGVWDERTAGNGTADVSLNVSSSLTPAVDFRGAVEDNASTHLAEETWFVHHLTVAIEYRSADLTYATDLEVGAEGEA